MQSLARVLLAGPLLAAPPGKFAADSVTRDPSRPARLQPDYHSGDHLHPYDKDSEAMGNAVPLELFRPVMTKQAVAATQVQ